MIVDEGTLSAIGSQLSSFRYELRGARCVETGTGRAGKLMIRDGYESAGYLTYEIWSGPCGVGNFVSLFMR
jgi:hypothetical protein